MKRKEKLLLLIIAAIVTIIVVTSCSRQFCQENYPCIDRDSTSIIQTANIDTIYIPMPADTVKLETQIDCTTDSRICAMIIRRLTVMMMGCGV